MTDPTCASRRKPKPEARQTDYEQTLQRLAGVVGKLLAKRWLEHQAQMTADPPCRDATDANTRPSCIPCMTVDDPSHATQEMAATDNTH